MREIEIKFNVSDLDALEKKLAKAGLMISKAVEQYDVIYSRTDQNIFNGNGKHTVARIREENGKYKLTLKQDVTSELDSLEYETEIGDRDAMHNILLLLGWKPEVEVKKLRKKGKLGEYEICLDRVEGLGDFMEIEKLTDENVNAQEVIEELFEAVKPYGISKEDEEKRGYDTQLYQLKNNVHGK